MIHAYDPHAHMHSLYIKTMILAAPSLETWARLLAVDLLSNSRVAEASRDSRLEVVPFVRKAVETYRWCDVRGPIQMAKDLDGVRLLVDAGILTYFTTIG